MHPNVDRVVQAAAAGGLLIEPRQFPHSTRTADEAAAAIGVPVGAIVKSLVWSVDGRPVLALVSGVNQLDEMKLAVAAGGASASRPDAAVVREATGFPIGGVPPFGHRTALPVYIDVDLLGYEVVWAAAGTPHVNFPIAPADLARVAGGITCDLRRATSASRDAAPSAGPAPA